MEKTVRQAQLEALVRSDVMEPTDRQGQSDLRDVRESEDHVD